MATFRLAKLDTCDKFFRGLACVGGCATVGATEHLIDSRWIKLHRPHKRLTRSPLRTLQRPAQRCR